MSPPAFVLRARSLSVDTGARVLFRDLDVTLTDSSRCGVVGPNGSGKSTLLRLLGGEQQPTAGTVALNPPTATIALVPQEPDRSRSETARRYLARRTHVAEAAAELEAASVALAEGSCRADDRFDLALRRYERVGCADFDDRTHETARRIGLDPVLLDRPTASLSGGEAARVSLAVVLLARADLLLLDEPTNDLDDEGLVLLDELVASTTSSIVVVSHDRVFLEQTVSSVVELTADGAFQFDGGWDAFVAEREARRRQAEEAWAGYDAERRRLTEIARRDRSWAQQGVHRAKTSGETDKFARFGAIQGAQNHGAKASVTQRALERLVPVDKPWEGWDLRLSIAAAGRSGSVVARLEDVTVRRGDQYLGPWNVELRWGDRVALVGPNGSGKTTIVDVLAGRLEVTSGRRHLGPSVVVGELRQLRLEALSTGDVLGWFLDASELTTSQGRSLLAKFGLGADHLGRPPTSLSTGERTRAELALFQARGVNLLLLDEPTNHLDLDAIEQLEQALASYEGTLVVVSHDRRFLEHITFTRTVALGPAPLPRTASADQSAAAPSRRNPTASSTDPT